MITKSLMAGAAAVALMATPSMASAQDSLNLLNLPLPEPQEAGPAHRPAVVADAPQFLAQLARCDARVGDKSLVIWVYVQTGPYHLLHHAQEVLQGLDGAQGRKSAWPMECHEVLRD